MARAATGRNRILKFEGCYHGHSDPLLVKAGSGLAGESASSSAGVSEQVAGDTLHVLPRVEGRGPADEPVRQLDPIGAARLLRQLGRAGAVGTRPADVCGA